MVRRKSAPARLSQSPGRATPHARARNDWRISAVWRRSPRHIASSMGGSALHVDKVAESGPRRSGMSWRGSQVVRRRSAKPLCIGSIPIRALFPLVRGESGRRLHHRWDIAWDQDWHDTKGEWWNGIHDGLKTRRPKGLGGSNPSSPTLLDRGHGTWVRRPSPGPPP